MNDEDHEAYGAMIHRGKVEARQKKEHPTVTYCTYGQCADRTVPCPSCTTIEVKGDDDEQSK